MFVFAIKVARADDPALPVIHSVTSNLHVSISLSLSSSTFGAGGIVLVGADNNIQGVDRHLLRSDPRPRALAPMEKVLIWHNDGHLISVNENSITLAGHLNHDDKECISGKTETPTPCNCGVTCVDLFNGKYSQEVVSHVLPSYNRELTPYMLSFLFFLPFSCL